MIMVEAFAASWIEIVSKMCAEMNLCKSKPLRLRGLKSSADPSPSGASPSKPLRLRGLKFCAILDSGYHALVEAFAASWIEISK